MRTESLSSRRGIDWPLRIDGRGRLALTGVGGDLRRSIWLLLSTEPGDRLMRPDLGVGLGDLLDTPLTPERAVAAGDRLREALDRALPGASIESVQVEAIRAEPGALLEIPDGARGVAVLVDYRELRTQRRHSVAYRRVRMPDGSTSSGLEETDDDGSGFRRILGSEHVVAMRDEPGPDTRIEERGRP